MRAIRTAHAIGLTAVILGTTAASFAAGGATPATRVRVSETTLNRIHIEDNARIREVFRYASKGSPSFQDVVATIEQGDRNVYIAEGRCPEVEQRACLQLARGQSRANLIVRLDPRETILKVATLLAHELYHVAEILREPDVDDAAGLHRIYERIGYRTCAGDSDACWETRAAVAFQELVWQQLSAPAKAMPEPGKRPSVTPPGRRGNLARVAVYHDTRTRCG